MSAVVGRPVRALPSLSFTTESGRAYLERHFADVVLHTRTDRLTVPVAEPIVAAAESVKGPVLATVGPDLSWPIAMSEYRSRVEGVIQRQGSFTITAKTGVFICRGPSATQRRAETPDERSEPVIDGTDVLAVIQAVQQAGPAIWLDGGWGVDALLGRQHRDHDDLDVVVDATHVVTFQEVLASLGFFVAEDYLPTRLVLRTADGRQVDVHPVTFDVDGTGWQAGGGPDGGDCPYPAAGFTTGVVAGRSAGCLTAELQVEHHRGYDPTDRDRDDLRLLAESFDLVLPPPY